ncbi:hypothetical protein D3C86_1876810 [compost metagenome]
MAVQAKEIGLTFFSLNQPATINNSASGGNTLINENIADVSSFLFFVMTGNVYCNIAKKSCNCLQDFFVSGKSDVNTITNPFPITAVKLI